MSGLQSVGVPGTPVEHTRHTWLQWTQASRGPAESSALLLYPWARGWWGHNEGAHLLFLQATPNVEAGVPRGGEAAPGSRSPRGLQLGCTAPAGPGILLLRGRPPFRTACPVCFGCQAQTQRCQPTSLSVEPHGRSWANASNAFLVTDTLYQTLTHRGKSTCQQVASLDQERLLLLRLLRIRPLFPLCVNLRWRGGGPAFSRKWCHFCTSAGPLSRIPWSEGSCCLDIPGHLSRDSDYVVSVVSLLPIEFLGCPRSRANGIIWNHVLELHKTVGLGPAWHCPLFGAGAVETWGGGDPQPAQYHLVRGTYCPPL